ncbi:hypothetical protein BD410DRAFT_316574 [Rickenella mellea]|uniref:Uncharacterized protein n=1 Tax=Rickenella mellea TaxID=50990 RepID=A0A4Y7Q1M7_9AGAM|nr:hypothetical protein BD410DRAFT_316574 [Rickenella mellea]
MNPWDGFSEYSPVYEPVGTFGYFSQESAGMFIPLGRHSCIITELCTPSCSTYGRNDWEVVNGEMRVSARIEQARLSNPDPFVFLCEYGPALSYQHSLKMDEIMIVTSCHLQIEMKVKCKVEIVHPDVYFHLLPLRDGRMPGPCGYFSYSPDPLGHDAKEIPMVEDSAFSAEVTSFYKVYKSTIPGLSAQLSQDSFFDYGKLNEFQAHMVRWIHNVYAPKADPKSEINGVHGVITEIST